MDQAWGASQVIRNVSVPSLTPYWPAPENATGAAIIVAPGGGYSALAIHHEGYDVAQWLARQGIAALVLKYRVNATRDGIPLPTADEIAALVSQSAYKSFDCPAAVEDAAAAVRLVRQRAPEWNIDPQRVGFLGFSAGAISALKVATSEAESRPDFAASIYGPVEEISVPPDAAPLFGVLALDDALFAGKGFGLLQAWRKAGRPVEFMLYERGGHGFGLGRSYETDGDWPEAFMRWLRMRGVIANKVQESQ